MKILATIPLDYIMGHLRYGHFEGSFEIPDEDIEEFKASPSDYLQGHEEINLLDNLEILVDDYRIDDYGEPLFKEGQYKILPNKQRK